MRLELCCDGYDGIHSTVVCPYYINTGMFAGIGKSLIPVLTPEYVASETVKAVLVNQEVLCMPSILYSLMVCKQLFPTKTFLWFHRAIGAASTMKTFVGRRQNNVLRGFDDDKIANEKLVAKMGNQIHIQMPNQHASITINGNENQQVPAS